MSPSSKKSKRTIIIILWSVIAVLLLITAFFAYEKYIMGVSVWDNLRKSICRSINIPEDEIKNTTLSFNDDEQGVNDTFTLKDGVADLFDNSIGPRSYTFAAYSQGDVNSDGRQDVIMGIYKTWGANRITPIIFATSENNGKLEQLDYTLPDQSNWKDITSIQSISIEGEIITVNLLILSDEDKNLPHYQQQPSVPMEIKYRLTNGKLTSI